MIGCVLVANRGEIARRVMRTCRDLGIGTVAVFSDADADAPFVREADRAVHLPGTAPKDTYLRADLIVDAARRAGADAVHPGYGFLSENASFARQVLDAGLTWIGPSPDAIASMGSKIEAKKMMAAAGVPVLAELDPEAVTEADLPVLIKASAGGGGRGMRVVRELAALADELAAAQAEARSAFGDPTVFCEPYLPTGHHIEVQIMADRHGTVWAVGERECSIQRRHQKVVEEAPAPLVERTDGMRDKLYDAAIKAAQAIDYTGAGTVEFLADDDGRFYFLEMNTRLQVEHPVTECTAGLDLVALQLSVADGEPLPRRQPATHGHSIEVRLYAEDPAHDWQPQSGRIDGFDVPHDIEFAISPAPHGIRLDSGVRTGDTVSTHYDPMLAKVISWAPTRDEARRRLASALERAHVHGPVTNRQLLVNVLRHPAFAAGDTDTAFFATHGLADLAATPTVDLELSALVATLAVDALSKAKSPVQQGIPVGWRNVPSAPVTRSYDVDDEEVTVAFARTRTGVQLGDRAITLHTVDPDGVTLDVDGVRRRVAVAITDDAVYVDNVRLRRRPRFVDPADQIAPGSLLAPMPGSVVRIAVAEGDAVTAGQPVLWLEAMKMQHQINAPADGVVTELPVKPGQQVDVGAILAVVSEIGGDVASEGEQQ